MVTGPTREQRARFPSHIVRTGTLSQTRNKANLQHNLLYAPYADGQLMMPIRLLPGSRSQIPNPDPEPGTGTQTNIDNPLIARSVVRTAGP